MPNQNARDERSSTDQILDLLLDALAERQKARWAEGLPSPPREKEPVPPPRPEPLPRTEAPRPEPGGEEQRRTIERRSAPRHAPARPAAQRPSREPKPGDAGWEPPPRQPTIQMGKMMGRLALLTAVLIVLVNIPVNIYGVSLARIMPEASSLIIRDGLVLKGSGPEIYMLEDERLRWISSMDAFEHLGLSWGDVHVVEDSFLARFKEGRPIHVLLKCQASPHIYRLENDQKRWIEDIDTFVSEGHEWEDVRFVSCQYLRDLPTGPSIPEDAGPAPEP